MEGFGFPGKPMTNSATYDISNLQPLLDSVKTPSFTVVLASKEEGNLEISNIFTSFLQQQEKDSVISIYPLNAKNSSIEDITKTCLPEKEDVTKTTTLLLNTEYDEDYAGKPLPNEVANPLGLLAWDLDIKVILLTSQLTSLLEQDAGLIVKVTPGKEQNTVTVLKHRTGQTGTFSFTL